MLLIASGAYVEQELFSEFGKLPPCFLPVGNKLLLCYQLERFGRSYDTICLTLPDDFEPDELDVRYLEENHVRTFPTCSGASLGSAMLEFFTRAGVSGQIDILYGDTLVSDSALDGTDWIAVGRSWDYYHWHHEKQTDENAGYTWTGMFSFSDADLLRRKLIEHHDFIMAVTAYGEAVGHMERRPIDGWLDFGHVHTYFDSKRTATTQRHFNCLTVSGGITTKSSADKRKILAEAEWLEHAPPQIRLYLPVFIDRHEDQPASYSLEYLSLATLNELYVFGRLPDRVWRTIFTACEAYFEAESRVPVDDTLPDDFAEGTYRRKTMDRLRTFCSQSDIDLHSPWTLNGEPIPSLLTIAEEAAEAVMALPPVPSFIHGDFCFSNILFDFRSRRIKVIDPRGMDASCRITPFGDFRYDIGKLAHSVLGLYDFIVAGRYELEVDRQAVRFRVAAGSRASLQRMFSATQFRGKTPAEWDCYPLMLLLFLSMLPLHAEDSRRQGALLANCLRIYLEWKHDCHPDGRK